MNDRHDLPRVPGHPIFGNLLQLRKDRIGFLTSANAEHPLVRARHGIFELILSADPDFSHQVLVEQADAFAKGYGLSLFMRPMLGNGLLTSEGGFHKKQRKMMAPAFAHKRIAEYADAITENTAHAEARWKDGARIDFAEEMMHMTLQIVGKTLFDTDVTSDANVVGRAVSEAMKAAIGNIQSLLPIPPSWPLPRNLRAKKYVADLDAVIYRLIRERRADGTDHGDFLSMLLMAQDEDDKSSMSDKQVRDEAMTIFLAGHETTANALSWAFYLIAQHPAVRERLEREVDALGGRAPALADLANLPYALAVFKEAMRLYPPAYMVTRRALRPITIMGHTLAKNQLVLVNIVGMQRSARFFPDPMRFDPERFLPEREKQMNKRAYLPFAAGPRVCIGNHFALMEGQLAVATITQGVRLSLPAGSSAVECEPLVTLRPKGGMPMIVERRTLRMAATTAPARARPATAIAV